MLEINNISKKYKKGSTVFTALDNVSFRVEKGEFISVVGASGSGKSTLLHTIGGLNQPDSGQVLFHGRDIYSMNPQEANLYRKSNVGFVFQQFHLMPYLSVYENIQLVCAESAEFQKIEYYLEKCSLSALRKKYPSELSVGEKQRTAFVRAIISKPEILLADEPTGNLDPANSAVLMSLIADFHRDGGTVLLVSHNPETAQFANRLITLQSGKLV
jgi:putative ABC transport system ATP-binding protein